MTNLSLTKILAIGLAFLCIIVIVNSASTWRRRKLVKPKSKNSTVAAGEEPYKKSQFCPDRANDWGIPYRYYRPEKKCYLVGEQGPCNAMMEFTLQDDDYGFCDCDQSLRCGRPLIYWPDKKRCYFVNEQGPCSEGKWLVFGFANTPVCRKNPCAHKSTRAFNNFGQSFWFEKNGKCYKTGTQGYCEDSQERLINQWNDYRPTCSEDEIIKCGGNGYIPKMECLPGMKMDYYEKCIENLIRNRTREAELAAVEEAKKKKPLLHQLYPIESFPEDDTLPAVYKLKPYL